MPDVTQLLSAIESGDPRAADELLPFVYEELRKLAAVRLANEAEGQTLQPTALVHEAWLRLGGSEAPSFQNRAPCLGWRPGRWSAVEDSADVEVLARWASVFGAGQARE